MSLFGLKQTSYKDWLEQGEQVTGLTTVKSTVL